MDYKVVVKVKCRTAQGDVVDRDLLAMVDAKNQLEALKPAIISVMNSLLHSNTKIDRVHVVDLKITKTQTAQEFEELAQAIEQQA